TVEVANLALVGLARLQQRPNRSDQLRTIFDQLFSSHGEDVELGSANHKTEVFEEATNLVLKIPLDLHQQRAARQQGSDRMTVNIFDAHFFEPARLHDAGDASCIVTVTLINLHLQIPPWRGAPHHHGQSKSFKLRPQPSSRRASLQANPNCLS